MSKNLVIVESPTKAKTISKILGRDFSVVSSMGHLVDLPASKLGVNIEEGFKPDYAVVAGRQKVLAGLKKEAKDKDNIYVATDPDREGEAIGWHIKNKLPKDKKIVRVAFHEITSVAVKKAFAEPRDFDLKMVEAQIGRRVLDRIVGYFLSPLLWKKIVRGLSAGRVQSVALRLIVEREKEIKSFIPQEYWEIEVELEKYGITFSAKLEKIEGEKPEINHKKDADSLAAAIKNKQFVVADVKNSQKKRYPQAPFITSTMQQEAFNRLRFNATKTMIVAQQLYEGIDIGQETPVGLITYMRTDSTHVAKEAITQARDYIERNFGKNYLPDTPPVYKVKKFAQEAHEAIRPTFISRSPASLKRFLSSEQFKLYGLIYNRFIASQMCPAQYSVTTVNIQAEKYLFVATGSSLIFDGFLAVYANSSTMPAIGTEQNRSANGDGEEEKEKKAEMPVLEKNDNLNLIKVVPSQHFTKPATRFSDSSLVKTLEEDGIGRPSTYAPIISTLILRDYIRRVKGYFYPTELGFKVCKMLVEYFPEIMDVKFTANMEKNLDEIEEGKMDRIKVLDSFYQPFKKILDFAQANIKKEIVKTEEVCEKCGKPMILKWGRKGKFLSCSGYPECKFSKSITSGVKCPQEGCGGDLIERRSRRGFFYGCSNFPKCTFTSKALPEDKDNK